MLAERKVVTKIEANPLLTAREKERSLVRVAAYCRVSTDSDEQLDSYQAQITYYTDYIAKNPDWRFAGIYADEGITGTKAEKRPEFQRLMRDCKKRKIDMILTKSVARFARNTVDSLSYVRRLKAQGIGVFFEEQNLDSMKADSEMFIGIHSVLAQAESENISANVRWGIQQRMKSGTFKFRYNILGYRKGADGEPEIEPEGAETVRLIYDKYLAGESLDQIRASLIENGAKAFNGTVSWNKESIRHILTNERFCGDMLLQKTYIDNCISRKTKVNHGEMPKYLITNNHVPIISRDDFQRVQLELARRSSKRKVSSKTITEQGKYSGKYALSEKLICGECGTPYRRKTWMVGGQKKIVWRCINRIEHGTRICRDSITVEESRLHQAICKGLCNAAACRDEVLELIKSNLSYAITGNEKILDAYAIQKNIERVNDEMDQAMIGFSTTQGDKNKYLEVINIKNSELSVLREQLALANKQVHSDDFTRFEIEKLEQALTTCDMAQTTFSDSQIRTLVECIRVNKNNTIHIVLKGGFSITEEL